MVGCSPMIHCCCVQRPSREACEGPSEFGQQAAQHRQLRTSSHGEGLSFHGCHWMLQWPMLKTIRVKPWKNTMAYGPNNGGKRHQKKHDDIIMTTYSFSFAENDEQSSRAFPMGFPIILSLTPCWSTRSRTPTMRTTEPVALGSSWAVLSTGALAIWWFP
jgi:hypothetical protein